MSTFAGSGSIGSTNGTGTAASFNYPMGLVFDASGNLYVADAYNHRIRKITPSGVVSTYAGSGTVGLLDGALLTARFNYPMALQFDSNGDLYVADRHNQALRRISGSSVTTVAGNGAIGFVDGQGSSARFNSFNNMVVKGGNVYMVDQSNHALRYISPTGTVSTISTGGQFTNPYGIAMTSNGKFYITENTSNRIRRVDIQRAYRITPQLPEGLVFDESTGRITGKVSNPLGASSFTVTSRNNVGSSLATVTFSISNGPTSQINATGNYIIESTFRHPYKETSETTPVDSVNRTIQYFDGLGRPMQTVQWQGSPEKKDIVQHIEYDGFGRESKKYLPYVHLGLPDGAYKNSGNSDVHTFYSSTLITDIARTAYPYSETVFENSPLNRVLEQGAPGQAWQPAATRTSTGRTVVNQYGTNIANDVRLWDVTAGGASGTGYYLPGKLYKVTVKDENGTSGKAGTVDEYMDFEDRVVLKRVWKSESEMLDTYYVYDDFGDLRYVVPPGYTTMTITDDEPSFDQFIYAYRYDERRRMTHKKIPSKGWEWILYNKNDQPVLTQDSVQRESGKWSYTKYDAFGRVVSAGIYTNTGLVTYTQARTAVEAVSPLWESRTGTSYSNLAFPTIATQVLLINYYDDYSFAGASALPNAGINQSLLTKTLLTGSLISKDDGTSPLLTLHYYDDDGRIIQTAAQNHLGGTDYVTNTYNFVGELLTSKRQHKASPSGTVTTILTTNTYDHVGRLKETKNKVNNQPEVIQSRLTYNEIGQLKEKKLHSENGGTDFITSVDYVYNERGWLTNSNSPQFSYQLKYNDGTTSQYNGNISQQLWGHGATTNSTFSYSYDKLNRLTNGTSTGTVMSEVLSYDNMGNILTLKRDNGTTTNYSYTGNRLTALGGGLTGSYSYDPNGNALTDRTGMAFTYNYLNLPKTATKTGTNVAYLYDAAGAKLRKTATVSSTTTQRDYVGGIEYSKIGSGASTIEMIHTEEGYLQNNGGTYTYHYNLTDHLGNVRATLQRTTATTATVIQKHDYYPFGKAKAIVTSGINKYLYNGKELQEELDGQYDYGARFYDAEIGRWNVVDPHANLYAAHSPYAYGFNNPIKVIDPNGKDGIVTGSGTMNDPFRVKASYYYYDLDEDQISGLNTAIAQYNNGGKAHRFKDNDGNTIYTVFELNASQVSAENAGTAHDIAYNDRVEIGGKEYQYGNVISNGQSRGGDLGNATGATININRDKIESTLYSNPGGDRVKLITGTFVHEIGHNLGASHGDPGSIMNQMNMSEIGRGGNNIGGGGTGTFNYSYPSVNSSGIRAIMGRTNNPNSLESMYLSPREVRRVIQHKDPGAPGALYKVR